MGDRVAGNAYRLLYLACEQGLAAQQLLDLLSQVQEDTEWCMSAEDLERQAFKAMGACGVSSEFLAYQCLLDVAIVVSHVYPTFAKR